ncbi:uncharacterized protein LOC117583730 [Drosophila guanche]|uniref:Blast:Protein takeout n=1 Tax=Drosophila guanche TaxID=7266 RepID=A0A3B0K3K5_DROGU|nr:uncharacterized protein LOC117583730 [Drosophila guanche]SPP80559.1 blast:Protein takeout [Drosophila guanche]
MLQKIAKFLIILVVLTANAEGSKYLAQKPDFLTPCVVGDPSLNTCLAKNLQILFHQWKDGIPGYNALGSLDPLYIKRVKFSQDASQAIAINADLQNVYVTGGSQAVVKEANYDPEHYVIKALIYVPKLRFQFDYKLKGHVVALNLNGHGSGYFEAEKALLYMEMAGRPRVTPEGGFAEVDRVKISFREIKQFHIQLDNLFGGNKPLEDSAHTLFNENWREFYEVLRPAAEQTVQGVLLDRMKKTFAYVPASYFIKDFH